MVRRVECGGCPHGWAPLLAALAVGLCGLAVQTVVGEGPAAQVQVVEERSGSWV